MFNTTTAAPGVPGGLTGLESQVRGAGLTMAVVLALAAAGCRGDAAGAAPGEGATPPILIGQENVVEVTHGTIIVGPIVSGELRPQREAVLRAQVGGSMLEVNVEEGQSVRKGAVLGRVEAQTLDDARRSAASAVRSAEAQLSVAQREAERISTLVAAGAIAARELDLAHNTVTSAEAQLADARSRLVSAEKQLADAVIAAPLSGIVANRAVNAGDVVAPGTELFTIVDQSTQSPPRHYDFTVPLARVPQFAVHPPPIGQTPGGSRPLNVCRQRALFWKVLVAVKSGALCVPASHIALIP